MQVERKMIQQNVHRLLIKEFMMENTVRAGPGGISIQRTPVGTRVTMIAEKPGMVIGRKGRNINALTRALENDYKVEQPQIEVQAVEEPALNAQIMAQKLASALERGWHFRRAGHSTASNIVQAGAKGCRVTLSGKITGRRHRVEKFVQGHIKFCGEPALEWMERGFAIAKKKLGVVGVTVQIMHPNAKLPDEVELKTVAEVDRLRRVAAGEHVEDLDGEAAVDEALEVLKGDSEGEDSTPDSETETAPEEPEAATTEEAVTEAAPQGEPEESKDGE